MSRPPVVVDARGHRCPTPSLKLQKAMQGLAEGTRLVLLATDAMARIDAPYLMGQVGGRLVSIEETDGVLRITVETGPARPDAPTG
ncbi:MAG: SirA family protein [Brevundimonas sp.]|uniref:Sulfurtransferase TusA family protein n=1 Tax=Brevundimonas albigilva TaxID=1312364 RepID=A0ABY4SRF0_9CAUL|nr:MULTISPECIES: sulfurtransferase TusA family protein [Brevundimonas]MCV0416078.1 sulfurtransferase TusA family protein [Brevundimonas sp.]PZU55953.1 MAG: SirA family protein [Brevundimonas sp.]UQV18271.1 sulfurtransferase TusA family protein [Brevundimonas albigilva]URI16874.1 sulfurtransferase TusA family protein [Brevundimonas albigilva]